MTSFSIPKDKGLRYIQQYPKEFTKKDMTGRIWCKICGSFINPSRKSVVDEHRGSKGHKTNLLILNSVNESEEPLLATAKIDKDKFKDLLVEAMTSADIPLTKLRCPEMIKLFDHLGCELPSESNARAYILTHFAKKNLERLQNMMKDKLIYLIVDESEIKGVRYFNIIGALLDDPNKHYILETRAIPTGVSLDSSLVTEYILACILKFNIFNENVTLIISDAARYMMKAMRLIQKDMPNFFHVTCLAHLLHNCAMKIKATFDKVDNCIASVKAITTKNKTNLELFRSSIGVPPDVIITRWSSWLKGALFYCKHLPNVKKLVNEIKSKGVLIEKAKAAVNMIGLDRERLNIKDSYECLIPLLDAFEKSKLTIGKSISAIEKLDFKEDVVDLKSYIRERLDSNQIRYN